MSAALNRTFLSLGVPNYRRYFAGQVVSLSGNWMQTVAEMWLVVKLTGSGTAVGLTAALQFLPILVFGAMGGVLADRMSKRKLLVITQTLMAVPALTLWILTIGGYHGDRPPLDLDGFRACAAAMVPEFAEVAGTAEPLDDGKYFRFPASTRRRYERLQRFPERFVVMGDAVCSFNPVYGQGITVSAVEALALRHCLDDGSERLGIRFFDEIKPFVDVPWQIAAGADLELPDTPGQPPLPTRLINRYIARLQQAAGHDAELAGAFLRVANLMAPPPSLMRPDRMLRVLLKGRRRRQPVSDPAPGAIAATHATPQTWDVEPSGR